MDDMLRAPFPWFGGKSRVAHLLWERFGDVHAYVEPFAGSLATLLMRPSWTPGNRSAETVNDKDCYLANFWRAVKYAPSDVAGWCDWPVNEADLHARHKWLIERAEFRERMKRDPEFFDARIAGWWVWGISCFLGGEWCAARAGRMGSGRPPRSIPKSGNGVHARTAPAADGWFDALSQRLRHTEVCCGEWHRVLTPAKTTYHGVCGVLLDPPYRLDDRDAVYAVEDDVVPAVVQWATEHGEDHLLRIALCGYEGHFQMPPSWDCVPWKAVGGMGNQADGRGRENASRERIWFSPHCHRPGLFSAVF